MQLQKKKNEFGLGNVRPSVSTLAVLSRLSRSDKTGCTGDTRGGLLIGPTRRSLLCVLHIYIRLCWYHVTFEEHGSSDYESSLCDAKTTRVCVKFATIPYKKEKQPRLETNAWKTITGSASVTRSIVFLRGLGRKQNTTRDRSRVWLRVSVCVCKCTYLRT